MNNVEALLIEHEQLIKKLAVLNPVYGYETEDLEQEFRMVLMKCAKSYDPSKKVKFNTYLVTSCKNRVKNIKAMIYASRRPLIELSLNRIEKETGIEFINMLPSEPDEINYEDLEDQLLDWLAQMPYGEISIDYYFNEYTYEKLAEKYDTTIARLYRLNRNNIETLKRKLDK